MKLCKVNLYMLKSQGRHFSGNERLAFSVVKIDIRSSSKEFGRPVDAIENFLVH